MSVWRSHDECVEVTRVWRSHECGGHMSVWRSHDECVEVT